MAIFGLVHHAVGGRTRLQRYGLGRTFVESLDPTHSCPEDLGVCTQDREPFHGGRPGRCCKCLSALLLKYNPPFSPCPSTRLQSSPFTLYFVCTTSYSKILILYKTPFPILSKNRSSFFFLGLFSGFSAILASRHCACVNDVESFVSLQSKRDLGQYDQHGR